MQALRGRITAIDFETANYNAYSAISCAVVVTQHGEVVTTKYWLIRPPETYVHPKFTEIHGLTYKMVENAPSFKDIWPDMAPYIRGATMLAHNAGFDRGVLHAAARFHGIEDMPRNKWVCSLQASRKAWPDLKRHRLNAVCAHLDIPLVHHHAESDAMASWLVWKAAHEKSRAA